MEYSPVTTGMVFSTINTVSLGGANVNIISKQKENRKNIKYGSCYWNSTVRTITIFWHNILEPYEYK